MPPEDPLSQLARIEGFSVGIYHRKSFSVDFLLSTPVLSVTLGLRNRTGYSPGKDG